MHREGTLLNGYTICMTFFAIATASSTEIADSQLNIARPIQIWYNNRIRKAFAAEQKTRQPFGIIPLEGKYP